MAHLRWSEHACDAFPGLIFGPSREYQGKYAKYPGRSEKGTSSVIAPFADRNPHKAVTGFLPRRKYVLDAAATRDGRGHPQAPSRPVAPRVCLSGMKEMCRTIHIPPEPAAVSEAASFNEAFPAESRKREKNQFANTTGTFHVDPFKTTVSGFATFHSTKAAGFNSTAHGTFGRTAGVIGGLKETGSSFMPARSPSNQAGLPSAANTRTLFPAVAGAQTERAGKKDSLEVDGVHPSNGVPPPAMLPVDPAHALPFSTLHSPDDSLSRTHGGATERSFFASRSAHCQHIIEQTWLSHRDEILRAGCGPPLPLYGTSRTMGGSADVGGKERDRSSLQMTQPPLAVGERTVVVAVGNEEFFSVIDEKMREPVDLDCVLVAGSRVSLPQGRGPEAPMCQPAGPYTRWKVREGDNTRVDTSRHSPVSSPFSKTFSGNGTLQQWEEEGHRRPPKHLPTPRYNQAASTAALGLATTSAFGPPAPIRSHAYKEVLFAQLEEGGQKGAQLNFRRSLSGGDQWSQRTAKTVVMTQKGPKRVEAPVADVSFDLDTFERFNMAVQTVMSGRTNRNRSLFCGRLRPIDTLKAQLFHVADSLGLSASEGDWDPSSDCSLEALLVRFKAKADARRWEAAVCIQRHCRGFRLRKCLEASRKRQAEAAAQMCRAWRRYIRVTKPRWWLRRWMEEGERAATKIQAAVRGWRDRNRAATQARYQKVQQCYDWFQPMRRDVLGDCAVKIQRRVKIWLWSKRREFLRVKAAVIIQRRWRQLKTEMYNKTRRRPRRLSFNVADICPSLQPRADLEERYSDLLRLLTAMHRLLQEDLTVENLQLTVNLTFGVSVTHCPPVRLSSCQPQRELRDQIITAEARAEQERNQKEARAREKAAKRPQLLAWRRENWKRQHSPAHRRMLYSQKLRRCLTERQTRQKGGLLGVSSAPSGPSTQDGGTRPLSGGAREGEQRASLLSADAGRHLESVFNPRGIQAAVSLLHDLQGDVGKLPEEAIHSQDTSPASRIAKDLLHGSGSAGPEGTSKEEGGASRGQTAAAAGGGGGRLVIDDETLRAMGTAVLDMEPPMLRYKIRTGRFKQQAKNQAEAGAEEKHKWSVDLADPRQYLPSESVSPQTLAARVFEKVKERAVRRHRHFEQADLRRCVSEPASMQFRDEWDVAKLAERTMDEAREKFCGPALEVLTNPCLWKLCKRLVRQQQYRYEVMKDMEQLEEAIMPEAHQAKSTAVMAGALAQRKRNEELISAGKGPESLPPLALWHFAQQIEDDRYRKKKKKRKNEPRLQRAWKTVPLRVFRSAFETPGASRAPSRASSRPSSSSRSRAPSSSPSSPKARASRPVSQASAHSSQAPSLRAPSGARRPQHPLRARTRNATGAVGGEEKKGLCPNCEGEGEGTNGPSGKTVRVVFDLDCPKCSSRSQNEGARVQDEVQQPSPCSKEETAAGISLEEPRAAAENAGESSAEQPEAGEAGPSGSSAPCADKERGSALDAFGSGGEGEAPPEVAAVSALRALWEDSQDEAQENPQSNHGGTGRDVQGSGETGEMLSGHNSMQQDSIAQPNDDQAGDFQPHDKPKASEAAGN
uniref:IQ calmodulin-binding motif domain-containing protein n=1 Tax=Chromera velia CCMP2878 TaxID=1169474 RepID=A0A0G4GCE0_9ALVE|eukprot:Cvel_21273.t1-p1 / transcript=Cvel_21273.t1 / gene=Cvel_21273 / organism=Chromera_velia_CCMP2878 / gene_product=hypothetical protein / transcript_product=hypothetical protein / location=Cvel_scaffold1980:6077-14652(-) / protein_length=1573 / sequence_SO=supercontig / SO=protein_coding / is_pseudo=false